jgi:HNH endonuclease
MSRWNPQAAEERFWSHVDKRGPDECWEWIASLQEKGYGQFNTGIKMVRAHRFAYELVHGPTDKKVLHRCDNRKCVNERHLFVGTQFENMRDMTDKGRRWSRLSAMQVRSVKLYLLNGWTHKKIASHFMVSEQAISAISSGRNWAEVQPWPA